jgi:NifB/MoaA-like Fe-S oxidoreductase
VAVLTGPYGARVLAPLLASLGRRDVRVVAVENRYFGGNVGVSGLMVGEDLARVLAGQPEGHRYLLPDVCLTQGVFLDGTAPEDLPRGVEVVPTDGAALRRALDLPPLPDGAAGAGAPLAVAGDPTGSRS